ncbi:MAG: carbohydrate porin, partial [Cyclobacteriaceae bacterium]|nr:carbohydrate porin [Cyclobacteriaceae bacterium]
QPDFQYIINPGASESLKNAFVGVLRIQIEY